MVKYVRGGNFVVDLVACVLAGLGLWASFPTLSLWWLTIPALAVFFSRIDTAGVLRSAVLSAVFGFSFWLPLIEWVRLATGGWLPWVALVSVQVLFFVVFGMSCAVVRTWAWARTALGQAAIYAFLWVAIEQCRSRFPWTGFPWGNIAVVQVDSPLGHLAPLGGEVLVSCVTVLIAVLVRRAFALRMEFDFTRWWFRPFLLLAAGALFVGPLALPIPAQQEAQALTVGVIQGGVELPGARTFSIEGKVTSNHLAQTERLADSGETVDLVVWGETSADRDPRVSDTVSTMVTTAAERVNAPILLGFTTVEEDLRWNWIGTWYQGRGIDENSLYAKQKPVPFGEFIPWRSVISRLATEAAQVNIDMAAAVNPPLMEVQLHDGRRIRAAVGICFESAYESLIGDGVRRGGQLIITPSNNYHFRTSAESAQQGQLLRFRALEFSRSAIQASTTGESLIIRPNGSVQALTAPETADFIVGQVPLRTTITPAARMGEIPAYFVMLMSATVVFISIGGVIARRNTSTSAKKN